MNQSPAKSPHFTPHHTCDYFLPAHKTESANQILWPTPKILRTEIAVIASVDVDMLQHTRLELEYCADIECVTILTILNVQC
jgi:hypothetical protein